MTHINRLAIIYLISYEKKNGVDYASDENETGETISRLRTKQINRERGRAMFLWQRRK